MGGAASVPITSSVNPGQEVDVSVDLIAPSTPGHYRGYWKLKGEPGPIIFGIGRNASNPFWVDINVKGTPTTGVVYDFAANAGSAIWESSAGKLPSPGPDGDPKGFWLTGLDWKYEDGTTPKPAILVAPAQNITNGYIQGVYPDFKVQAGDIFKTQVGCELSATSCYVQFSLAYQIGDTGRVITIWRFNEKWDQRTRPSEKVYPDIKLDALAGKDVRFILSMIANGTPVGDRALWGNPVIVRKGIVPPTVTGTPPTATPSKTPGPITPTVPPSACDKVDFVKDVSYPDGALVQPGAPFTKTWRLKNVGTCPWTTAYQLVFFSGEQMGAPNSAAFPKNVGVGETVDVSVNMTAPSVAGSYRGFWMFKNAKGELFGWGRQGNQAWWVLIKVAGPTVTPGGPTKTPTPTITPGGPTFTPTPTQSSGGTVFDFAANAGSAIWESGAGVLPSPVPDGDSRGYWLTGLDWKYEDGTTPKPANGYIKGTFPAFRVQAGDIFKTQLGCEGLQKTSCHVEFRLYYQIGSGAVTPIPFFSTGREPFYEKWDGQIRHADKDYPDIKLDRLAGQDVKFILYMSAYGSPAGDRALWGNPVIVRKSGSQSGLPDLAISQVKVELQNPSCFSPGDGFGLRVWVINNGQAPAGSFAVKAGDAQQTVSGLAVGETKAVFLPNYVNQTGSTVTVLADSGGAVLESNEQNNSFSGILPVPTQPLPCTTVTPTATPTASASAYQNAKYKFKFTLPAGATIANQSDSAGRVNLTFTSGTNLLEKYVQVSVVENANPCLNPLMDGASASTESVTMNNIQFTKQTGQGVAAGNIYDWVAYSTLRNNACISLAFVLHSANPGNFPVPPPVFDATAESAVFGTIMSSFNWITP
jgi:hypothetical protein